MTRIEKPRVGLGDLAGQQCRDLARGKDIEQRPATRGLKQPDLIEIEGYGLGERLAHAGYG
jgi:hypothetical protein